MNDRHIQPTPDYDDPKELYAFFGLAFYKANVLEHGVLNLAVAMLAQGDQAITVGEVNRLYESFDNKTFGHVLAIAKQRYKFTEDFSNELGLALKYRNYLAHAFFRAHDIDIMSEVGRKKMIDELIEIWVHLAKVDEVIDKHWMAAWERYGVTKEWVDKQIKSNVEATRRNKV
ncbi:hypothetical protein [Ralstonia mannitolilytica]|uniref:hypothetical protein n=1 Tax=Ralstonia mannitolilytica TaxID=105219 RepID=UPI000C7BA050|nr:hypothetical protein [Ralstonia mannitolilytica]PLT18875.1 hypothetical protein CXP34_02445 [Ralstonia mannitolilytica]